MKKYIPWLFLISGIVFSTLIWNFISFPYDYSNTIVGQYSNNKFNPLNDTLRGLVFIFFPLTLYLISFLRNNTKYESLKNFQTKITLQNKYINFLCIIFVIFSIIEFYSLNYNNFLGELDVFHEGVFLTAQLNFFSKDQIWTGTFFDYGFLGNNIGVFFNYIFNDYSIGIQRFGFKYLILINKILIILICRKIILSVDSANNKELLFFIFSLCSLSLASFYDHVTPFHSRSFIYLIFTLLAFHLITSEKNNFFLPLIIGLFSVISILFYWDIGTYINVLIAALLIYLFFVKKYFYFFIIFFSSLSSWLIFFVFTPGNEFNEFVSQYLIILNISDYLIGIEFPQPFSSKSTRHTKALLLIIFSGVFLINYLFNKTRSESIESKFLLFFLFISAIIFFKSGLTRSDSPHIKYSSGQYMLLIFFFISYHLINFIQNNNFLSKIIFFDKKKYYLLSLSILISCMFFFKNNYSNILNIFNSSLNFQAITKVDDNKFLNDNYLEFLEEYKNLIVKERCVQQFTDDQAIPYLVNKPTCTKYYVSAHIIQNWTEDNFIDELNEKNPNYIIYSSSVNWFKDRNNAPKADRYILDNYYLHKDLSPWLIYKKNSI